MSGYDGPVTLRLALLGDSIASGQGASRPEQRLAPRLVRGLAAHGVEVDADVVAMSGARSAALRGQVERALRRRPQLAVVVVGANDLGHQVHPDVAARELGTAVRRLTDAGTEVVVAPAPDLSVVPSVPARLRRVLRAGAARLRARQVEAVLANGGRVADREGATSAAFAADRSLFSEDLFHPSGAGYAVIADALLPHLLDAVEALRQYERCPGADPGTAPTAGEVGGRTS